jgi:uncharacterized protein
MPITLYQASVPVFQQHLKALKNCLTKAEAHAQALKVDAAVLLQARLYPNMFALVRQVQLSSDFAKGPVARLRGQEPPKFEDTEATFADLYARIDKTLAYLAAVKADEIDGQEDRVVELKVGGQPMSFKGVDYLLRYALGNFFFHVTMAYALMRHNGVELGKKDFMGGQ